MRKQSLNSKKEELRELLSGRKRLTDLISYEIVFYVLHNGTYTDMKTGEEFNAEEHTRRANERKTLVMMPDNGRRIINNKHAKHG